MHGPRPRIALGIGFGIGLRIGVGLGTGIGISIGGAAGVAAATGRAPNTECSGCHRRIYESYARHGMAQSLGRVGKVPVGKAVNPKTGWSYELLSDGEHPTLRAVAPDGGIRMQRVVGRIGAGVFDTSWVTAELGPTTGEPLNRLFFAPVESVTGHGLELSPFEHSERPAAVDMPLTADCLVCHTDSVAAELPGAASHGSTVAPANALGVDAFSHLEPLGCAACHRDPGRHLKRMREAEAGEVGLERLSELPPGRQRDVCARCHLQGEVRFQLDAGRSPPSSPLAARLPTLVAAEPGIDFRFVGQLERLALSDCFAGSPQMTCTTCHDPHTAAKAQGVATFERACLACHPGEANVGRSCARPAELEVASVSGEPARGVEGCVDCHVRRSQPFDLPGIRSTDHLIRRRIEPPGRVPFRSVSDPGGELRLWDDGRLEPLLAGAAGERWRHGLLAMARVQLGEPAPALEHFDRFPAPGSADAVQGSAPAPLVALETWPTFHQLRGMALLGARRVTEAEAAFADALRLDPDHPGALMGRARLALLRGDRERALVDTQRVIDAFPESEAPWQLRTLLARRLGRPDFEIAGLEAAVKRWPSDARSWLELARLYRSRAATGDAQRASDALDRVRRLAPSLLSPASAER